MKKLFLLLAFTGIVGASSATSIASLNKSQTSVIKGGDKDKKKKKGNCCAAKTTEANKDCTKAAAKSCTKDAKSCTKESSSTTNQSNNTSTIAKEEEKKSE